MSFLEFEFESWLGDSILTTHPCFLVTRVLADDMERARLTGLRFVDLLVTVSETFRDIHGLEMEYQLPEFRRLIPTGTARRGDDGCITEWSGEDVCLTERADLIVSERCMAVLRRHSFDHCIVRPLAAPG